MPIYDRQYRENVPADTYQFKLIMDKNGNGNGTLETLKRWRNPKGDYIWKILRTQRRMGA